MIISTSNLVNKKFKWFISSLTIFLALISNLFAQSNQTPLSNSKAVGIFNVQTKQKSSSSAIPIIKIQDEITSEFGDDLIVEKNYKPSYLISDFNGDGYKDIAVVVRLKGEIKKLSDKIRVLNPYLTAIREAELDDDPSTKDVTNLEDMGLVLIHGSSKGWSSIKDLKDLDRFLLLDSVSDSNVDGQRTYLKIYKVTSKAKRHISSLTKAKGDCIFTGHEDANGLIYWNGQTYCWLQQGD
jgi:hypothetical protein